MLILPSVGARVKTIVLSKKATRARIFFDDGSKVDVVPVEASSAVRTEKTPINNISRTSVAKKKVIKQRLSEGTGMPSFRTVKTSQGNFNVPTSTHIKSIADPDVANIVERAKKRAAMLESRTMDASQALAMKTPDGSQIELSQST